MQFIHTSDWHLGHVYRRLGPRAGESAQWRFDAVRRIFDLAAETKADFILVAGDVFDTETPSPAVMQSAVELLRDAPVPIYLISGNHDPSAEGSVWFHAAFAGALAGVNNVHLARTSEPLQVDNGNAVLFPCPVSVRHTRGDSTAWIPDSPRSNSQFRIGLAHGGWKGYWTQSESSAINEISNRCADRCGLDYLALGDYHSFTPPDHPAALARTYYSGTPEVTAGDDARAGNVLLVEISKPGAEPIVTPHSVGRARCYQWGEIRLQPGEGASTLEPLRQAIEDPHVALVRGKVTGCVSHREYSELQEWINVLREEVLGADIDTSTLLTEPTEADFLALKLELPERQLLESLEAAWSTDELAGVSEKEIVAEWSQDEAARRAARNLYYELLSQK